MKKKILVVDIGGSNVKLMISAEEKRRKFPSGPKLSPNEALRQIREVAADWDFEAVSIGFPAPVRDGKILSDPKHLGKGWAGFDFAKALGKPVRLINDAALQALGSYRGAGRMLFLGLGTGLGSALTWEGHVLSLELGELPFGDDGVIEDWLGDSGLEALGRKYWQRETLYAISQLKLALHRRSRRARGREREVHRETARRFRARPQPQRLPRRLPALGNRSGNKASALARHVGWKIRNSNLEIRNKF